MEPTAEQREIIDAVTKSKENVFFTGSGGTGKSFVLARIRNVLSGSGKNVAVTATTGRAAFDISGMTLHSFAGIGLGTDSVERLVQKLKRNAAGERWREVHTLIIDEVSMLSGHLFDKLEQIARAVRNINSPFGGIQLVLVGDLLQLPPVTTKDTERSRVFEAKTWSKCITRYLTLKKVFRQEDQSFVDALNCIRIGATSEHALECMEKVQRQRTYEDDQKPVLLYATKARVNDYNITELNKLDTEKYIYESTDRNMGGSAYTLESCPAPKTLELKVGAQVMLIKNISRVLVNGTVGTIVSFSSTSEKMAVPGAELVPIVRFSLADGRLYISPIHREVWETRLPDGKLQTSRKQIPLILAWAMTIHKAQGQTIQRLKVDLNGVFECGQVYTALSRAVSLDTLEVVGFDKNNLKTDLVSLQFCLDNNLF